MSAKDEEQQLPTENSGDEAAPKQKMSARYNLFRYKSKDISAFNYNCKYDLF